MKNTNKYGFYSGGYVFDRVDRYALRVLNNAYPETKDELWFTEHADIHFYKQLCCSDATLLRTIKFEKESDSATVGVELIQGKMLIARSYVWFSKARNNFCKIKEQKNDA